MAKNTKHRILKAARSNFNEAGYFNVRLQDIADSANMSVGNMAYHFKHKIELFNTIYHEWKKQVDFLLADIHLTPIFSNLDIFLGATFELQQQFRFLYTDQLELIRMSPEIKAGYHEYFQNHEEQLNSLLALYHARGVVDWKSQNPQLVAYKMRKVIDTWLVHEEIDGKEEPSLQAFQAYLWSELEPYFTLTGKAEFAEKNNHENF